MSIGNLKDQHSEDYFAETRMSFGDHIEELRQYLWRAIIGFLIAVVAAFFFGNKIVDFIAAPVEQELGQFYKRRLTKVMEELRAKDPEMEKLNLPQEMELFIQPEKFEKLFKHQPPDEFVKDVEGKPMVALPLKFRPLSVSEYLQPALAKVGRRPTMSTLSVQEAFMVYFKVCMVAGLVLASPWVFYQLWSFVAAGLYPHEKKYVNIFLPVSLGLFLAGVLVCQFIVIPKAIEALLFFNEWMNLEPEMRLNEWLSFAIMMPVIFGISFQTPLVMLFLERIGLVPVELFQKSRRIAYFGLAVFAAVGSPSVDALSMLYLWVPLCFLYEMGIILIKMAPARKKWDDSETPESQELIEV